MLLREYPKNELKVQPAIYAHMPTLLPRHILVGYWHNWNDQAVPFIRLGNISPKFDVVNVAFALPDDKTLGQMVFHVYKGTTPDQFKADVAYLHSMGKKVLISVGGATGSLALTDGVTQDHFVESMTSIIEEYDFDGIDINLEGKIMLDQADVDFRNPTSPSITNLIDAIWRIRAWFGPNFMLSMAPETIAVQGGYKNYSGLQGSYLPIIEGLRKIITYVHVQHYNSEPLTALDGKTYPQDGADFHVAMAEMLLQGFPVSDGAMFMGLKPEQIVIGLPAFTRTTPGEIQKVLNYLTTGASFGGKYELQEPYGYPDFRGIMTWSINWDAKNCHDFSSNTRSLLDELP